MSCAASASNLNWRFVACRGHRRRHCGMQGRSEGGGSVPSRRQPDQQVRPLGCVACQLPAVRVAGTDTAPCLRLRREVASIFKGKSMEKGKRVQQHPSQRRLACDGRRSCSLCTPALTRSQALRSQPAYRPTGERKRDLAWRRIGRASLSNPSPVSLPVQHCWALLPCV